MLETIVSMEVKKSGTFLLTLSMLMALAQPVLAERCLNGGTLAAATHGQWASRVAWARSLANGNLFNYVKNNCTAWLSNETAHTSAMVFGPASKVPTQCDRNFQSMTPSGSNNYYVKFGAVWANMTARSDAGSAAGCEFMCGGLTCRVRASDGLPVELLHFGVE